MDEDIFDQMVEALNPETVQEPPIQTSTRWKPDGTYDSKPLDPNIFQNTIKKIINPFHLSRLRTHHFVQIQFIQTSSDQHLYEKQMPLLKGALRHLTARFVQRVFQSKIFSITTIFIEKVFMLKSNPNPKNSNRQPEPKTT